MYILQFCSVLVLCISLFSLYVFSLVFSQSIFTYIIFVGKRDTSQIGAGIILSLSEGYTA